MNDLDLFEYWNRHCGNMYNDTSSLCYWVYCDEEVPEEILAEWEQSVELKEYMSDWDEYVGGR